MQFQISFSLFLLSIGLIATRGQGAYYGGNTYYKCMGCCYGLRLYVRCSDVCALNPACYVNDHCWKKCVKSVCVFGHGYGHSINKNRDATLAQCLKQCTVCPTPSPTTTTSTSTTTTTTTLPPVCSLPPPTDNGAFVIDPPPADGSTSVMVNAIVTYTCNTCYKSDDVLTYTCKLTGNYDPSGIPPNCSKVRCQGIPQAPEGGSVSTQDNTCGTLVVYSCDSCSNLVGSATRTCLENGEWSSEEPTCEKLSCDPIRAPKNGQRSPPQGNEECNDKISFECNEGYEVKGAETIICTRAPGSSPQWNEAPPICYPICGKWVKLPCGDCITESHRQRCGTQKCSWVCEKCGSVRDYWRDPPGKKRDVVVSKRDFKFDSACTIGDRKEVSNFCCHFRK